MAKAPQRRTPAKVTGRPVVQPTPDDPKSGCYHCPLYAFSADFDETRFQKDAAKIRAKAKEPHTVRTRNAGLRPWNTVDVLFVGEAPGGDDDREGVLFSGRAGKLLRKTVGDQLSDYKVAYTYLVRCRPPRNRDPGKTEVKCCSSELLREIEARKPRLIVCLGNQGLDFLCNQTGILTYAGRLMRCRRAGLEDQPVMACMHPAYVIRFDHEMKKFIRTIKNAAEFLDGKLTMQAGAGTYEVLADPDAVLDLLERLHVEQKTVYYDTETGAFSPFQTEFPHLLCVAFTNEAGKGWVIPWDHADSPFKLGSADRPRVKKAIQTFVTSGINFVAQNDKFDRQHIRKAFNVEMPIPVRDTMTTHMVLDERRGTHGLKSLAHVYTGMGGYEDPLDQYIAAHRDADPERGGSYANIPGDILFPYCAMDADVTCRVDAALISSEEYQKNAKLRTLAEVFLPELGATLADMEYAGAKIDRSVVEDLHTIYSQGMEDAKAKIRCLPTVLKFVAERLDAGKKGEDAEFNPASVPQLQKILFGHYGLKPTTLTDAGFDLMVTRHKRINDEAKSKGAKPVAFQDVVRQAIKDSDWSIFTTDAEALHEFAKRGNDLCPLILDYRDKATIFQNFIEPLMNLTDAEGMVHGSFHTTGTATGRLASSNPNLQNQPNKDGGKTKRSFVSRFGDHGILLQGDYSQVELRVAACWYNDKDMMKAYNDGIDLHALTAADMHKMTLAQFEALPAKEKKLTRTRAKRLNFGCLYGGGGAALQSALRKDGVDVTIEECYNFIEAFFKARPGLKRGIENAEQKAKKAGYLETFSGRRRRLPEVFNSDPEIVARALRQGVNFPIQSMAAEFTLMALVLINREMKKRKLRSKLNMTVHDSILFDCHVDEMLEVALLAKDIMENLPAYSEQVLPGLDWSWLRVPVVADFECGVNWGQMVDFDPTLIGTDGEGELWQVDDKGKTIPARKPCSIDELWEMLAWKMGA
jgi:uracil-DNA glycosylase family 4